MARTAILAATVAAAALLSGCAPSYSPQELAAVRATSDQHEADARAHRITFVEAARLDAAKAREVGGTRVTADDELNFALKTALAAEVDAGRMTPEMASLRFQEQLAHQRQAAQAQDDEQRRRFGEAMILAGQSMQNAAAAPRPVSCTSQTMGRFTNTSCY